MVQGYCLHGQLFVFENYFPDIFQERMKYNFEIDHGPRIFKLGEQDFLQASKTIDMQISIPLLEMHGENEAGDPEIVVAVQVTDKNVIDFVNTNAVSHEL